MKDQNIEQKSFLITLRKEIHLFEVIRTVSSVSAVVLQLIILHHIL